MSYVQKTKVDYKLCQELYRLVILAKWGKKCLRCSKTYDLQVAHIYPVGQYRKLEFDTNNALVLCQACHLWFWHKNPIEASAWATATLPKELFKQLDLRRQVSGAGSKDYKLIQIYLKQELEKLTKQ